MDISNIQVEQNYKLIRFVDIFPTLDKEILFDCQAYYDGEWHDLSNMNQIFPPKEVIEKLYVTNITPFQDEDAGMLGIKLTVSDTVELVQTPTWMQEG